MINYYNARDFASVGLRHDHLQPYGILQDFDLAKRHYGEVITNYDPENLVAKDHFKRVKGFVKKLNGLRTVRFHFTRPLSTTVNLEI
jgi:hypothetical protein